MNDIRNHWGLGDYVFSPLAVTEINRLRPMEFQRLVLALREKTGYRAWGKTKSLPDGFFEMQLGKSDLRLIIKKAGNKIYVTDFLRKSGGGHGSVS
jgi:hypothetical protein